MLQLGASAGAHRHALPEGRPRGDAGRAPDLGPEALGGGRQAAGGDARAAGEPGHGRRGVDLAGGAEARRRAPRLRYAVDHGVVQGLAAALRLDDERVGRRVAGAEVDPDAGGLVFGLLVGVVDEGVPVHPRRLAAAGGRRGGGLAAGTPSARDGVADGGEGGRGRDRRLRVVADAGGGKAGVLVVDGLGRGARRGLGGLDLRLGAVGDGVGHEHERVVGDRPPGVGPRRPVVPVLDGEQPVLLLREAVVHQALPGLQQLRLDPPLRQLHLGRQLVAGPQPGVLLGAPRVLLVQQPVEALVVLARVLGLEGAEAHVGVDFDLGLDVVIVETDGGGGARLRGDRDGRVACYEAAGRLGLRAGRQRRAPPRPPAARRHDVLETPAGARDPFRVLRVEGVQVLLLRLALEKAREEVPRYDLGERVGVAVFADDLPRPLDSLWGRRRRHELEIVVSLADEGGGGLCVGFHGCGERGDESEYLAAWMLSVVGK